MASLLGGVFYFCNMAYTDHTNPDTAAVFGAVAPNYDAAFKNSFDRAEEEFIFNNYIMPHIGRSDVLDIGCGTGLVKKLADRFLFGPSSYTGVDFSIPMIEQAVKNNPVTALSRPRFVAKDMVEFMDQCVPESYDVVVAMYFPMNYCLYPPKRIYQAVKRVLKPGGRLITHVATSRYGARESHIVSAGNMRRYYHHTNDAHWLGDNIPKGMKLGDVSGINYFIERYRRSLQLCPKAINKKLFAYDQRRGVLTGATPYMYILNIEKL